MRIAAIIPARMASVRLPEKVIANINGKTLIQRAVEQMLPLREHNCDLLVACDDQRVADSLSHLPVECIMTDPALPSGTDRVYAAYKKVSEKTKYDLVVNIQGDMPNLSAKTVIDTINIFSAQGVESVDIATCASPITDQSAISRPSVVKPVMSFVAPKIAKALYFSRSTVPHGEGDYYSHIGLYVYTAKAIEQFVSFPPSDLEKREKLEQLRAMEHGLSIYVAMVDDNPISIDTPEDLELARKIVK